MSGARAFAVLAGLLAQAGLVLAWAGGPARAGGETNDCTAAQAISTEFVNPNGLRVAGGNCIPGERIPSEAEYSYTYEALCQPNVPEDCAPRVCDTAESPARLFIVTRTSFATGGSEQLGAGCYSTKNDPPKITPGDVLEKLKTLSIPKATIAVQPPDGRTLVNFKTIVSSSAAPYEDNVQILGQNVHLWIRPDTWTWDFGDGSDPLATKSAGLPWTTGVALSDITAEKYTFHEYTSADDFTINLTVTWTADFQVGDQQPKAVPGSVDITSPGAPIKALEARPQLVR